jgi:hypothetical protein
MQGCKTLTIVRPPAIVAMFFNTSNSEPASPVCMANRSDQHDLQDNCLKFREDIRRRYEAPFQTSWLHGGINE